MGPRSRDISLHEEKQVKRPRAAPPPPLSPFPLPASQISAVIAYNCQLVSFAYMKAIEESLGTRRYPR